MILLQQIVNGLALGSSYALMALAYALTFGVLRVINLAYAELFMITSYLVIFFSSSQYINPVVAAALAPIGISILGLIVHSLAVRPLGNVSDVRSPRHLAALVSTLGAGVVLQNLVLVVAGPYPRRYPRVFSDEKLEIFGVQMELPVLFALVSALGMMMVLGAFLKYTNLGLRIRALADNRELAVLSGLRVGRDEYACVALSGLMAGIAAIFVSEIIGTVSPFIGGSYGLKGLIVLIIGGTRNLAGAVLMGLVLGLAEALAVLYVNSSYRDAIAHGILILIILVRSFRQTHQES